MMRAAGCGPENWVFMAHGFGKGRFRGGRPWWAGAMEDPPPRAERGEIRYLVLDAIKERPRHGYEVIQIIEQRAGGSYRPSPGVIYPTLQMLEELGHAKVIEQEGRKAYEITDAGRSDLEQNVAAVDDFYQRFEEEEPWETYAEDFADVMRRVAGLMKAFKQASRNGRMNPETLRGIRRVLDEALRGIEDVLKKARR